MPTISRFKSIALIIAVLCVGFGAGAGWMFYLAKTGPEQLFIDGLHIQTTDAVVNLTLLKEKRYEDLSRLLEARIAMSGTAERLYHHPKASSNAQMIKGYYSLIASDNPPPAIATFLSEDSNAAMDPRSLADAMLKGSMTVLYPPTTSATK
jgi:hypothetical protein